MIEPEPLNRGNIMAVDDNPANLKLLEGMLRQQGYQVRSFPRGRLALASAAENPPELILLDINMPVMDGYPLSVLQERRFRCGLIARGRRPIAGDEPGGSIRHQAVSVRRSAGSCGNSHQAAARPTG